jgi:conjugative relaxase-like TrwC/TraI family protein
MLSLSPGGMSASHASGYFSREDYYLRGSEPSQWLGKGSAALGLKGEVQEEDFRRLAQGKAPDGSLLVAPKLTRGEAGAQLENHRAGNDLTFSAPKSVSVGYAAGNQELKDIWDQAVVNAMKHVEAHYSQYRARDGVRNSGNIVAAKFDHVTSRALDPEVHSHVFLLNMTRVPGGGGKWKANEPKNIYTDKISLGMLARQEAMYLYRKAGYATYFTNRGQLLFEVEGVSPRELETFSKRSAAIAGKVAQWKEQKRFPGVSGGALKGMAALDTRDPRRAITREDVRREWDRGFEAAGTTAREVRERIEASRRLHPAEFSTAPPQPDGAAVPPAIQVLRPGGENWSKDNPGFVAVLLERRRNEYLYGDTAGKLSNDQLRDYARDGNPTAQPEIDRRYINEAFLDFEQWSTPSGTQDIGETVACLEGLREAMIRHDDFLEKTQSRQETCPPDAMVPCGGSGSFPGRNEFLRRVDDRIKALNSRLLEGHTSFRYKAPGDYPQTLAVVLDHVKVPELKGQPGYREAKHGGDLNAARQVVDALVRQDVVAGIRGLLPDHAAVYVVAVGNRVGPHLNRLPAAYAERLARDLGGEVWTGIAKVSGGPNTGAAVDERLHNRQVFEGPLPPRGSAIVIADDTFTVGGTLAALVDHLAREGNTPVCATTLATGRYGPELVPTRELIDGLLDKAGVDAKQFEEELGYPPGALTGAEIRSFLRNGARGIDGARARFFASGAEAAPSRPDRHQPQAPEPREKSSREVIRLASGFLTNKEAVFDRADLLKAAVRISGGGHSLADLNAAVDGWAGRKNGIERLGLEGHGRKAGKEFYSTYEMRALEESNIEGLKKLRSFESVTCRAEVEAYLAKLSRDEGVVLSSGQQCHVLNELAGTRGLCVTQGDPGTGKTFSAEIIERFNREVLQPSGRNHYTINLAYTGKAALELSKANGRPAYTVDSFLNSFHNGAFWREILGQIGPQLPCGEPGGARRSAVQMVLKVDEASFVGGRQAEHLLHALAEIRAQGVPAKLVEIGDRKQMQSIQASPFFDHACGLAKRDLGDYAELKEIRRQKNADLRQVAGLLNRENPAGLGANAQQALGMLERQGRVTEIWDRQELIDAAIAHYLHESAQPSPDPLRAAAGERKNVLLVTPLNLDREDLNMGIRAACQADRRLGPGRACEVLTRLRQDVTVSNLEPGMTLVFNGERGEDGRMLPVPGTYLNQRGEIQSTDPERNTVTVRLARRVEQEADQASRLKESRNITRTFQADRLCGNATLYRREERVFAPGDRVVFGATVRNRCVAEQQGAQGRQKGVRNGEMGEIVGIGTVGRHGIARVRLDGGRDIDLHLDRFGPQVIDYGYAVTVYKGQGGTVDSVLPFHYVKPGVENDQRMLEALTGVKLAPFQYRQWNTALSDFEKEYRADVTVGGHRGELGFLMIREKNTGQEHKGVAISFFNGPAVIADQSVRSRMRDAGMYWSPERGAWVTAATNDRALALMDHHPLRDPGYTGRIRAECCKAPAVAAALERNFQAEIDSKADAEKFGCASYNSFNVAVTRARHDAMVFTNSVAGLKQAVLTVDEKTSTVDNPLQRRLEKGSRQLKGSAESLPGMARQLPGEPVMKAPSRNLPRLGLKR